VLPLAGIAQRAHNGIVDLRPARRYHKAPLSLVEKVAGEWFDTQCGAVGGHLNFPRAQAKVVTQWFGDNQSSCLIDGCTHA